MKLLYSISLHPMIVPSPNGLGIGQWRVPRQAIAPVPSPFGLGTPPDIPNWRIPSPNGLGTRHQGTKADGQKSLKPEVLTKGPETNHTVII